jgi:ATP-dependent helicase HrpB
VLVALAYPDRVARRRAGGGGRLLLRGGRGAVLPDGDPLRAAEYLAVAELDGRGQEGRVRLAAPVTLAELEAHFGEQIAVDVSVAWDDAADLVRATRRERLGALVLAETAVREPDAALVAAALLDVVRREWPALLDDDARRVRDRIAFARALEPGRWPDVSDAALLARLDAWLPPHLHGLRRRADLARLDGGALLLDLVPWAERQRLDALAPTHVEVPSGSRLRVDYADAAAPVLAVRLQELFGLADTPRVGGGRVPLTLHLLSPAHRPVQVTRDLAGFWRSSYHDVRRELRGRYPRHAWPDDPLAAEPTRRAKPRG